MNDKEKAAWSMSLIFTSLERRVAEFKVTWKRTIDAYSLAELSARVEEVENAISQLEKDIGMCISLIFALT